MSLKLQDEGLINYRIGLETQEMIFDRVFDKEIPGVLMLCEHQPVYTFGKSADHNNLLITEEKLIELGAEAVITNRGGDITFHGPGQLVGYPILNLSAFNLGVKRYVYLLEESLIRVCAQYHIEAVRIDGLTGVWLLASGNEMDRKIAALGIRVSKGITMHGFALNINTDLNYFNYMIPCGIINKSVTSLQKELGREVNMKEVKMRYYTIFNELLMSQITY